MRNFFVSYFGIAIMVAASFSSIAHAEGFDEQFYSTNDILFYDPRSKACEAQNTGISVSGSDNQQKAFNFFISKGYSTQQAAGIVGNMIAESGVLPMRQQGKPAELNVSSKEINGSGSGWGIVQWTPPSKMINPSLAAGNSHSDIDTLEYQLQFLWEQLEGKGTGAKISEKAAGDDLKQQTTVAGAARSFMTKYERPADQGESAQKHRSDLANGVFGKYASGASSVAVDTSSSSTPTSGGCNTPSPSGGSVVSIAQAELAKNVMEQPIGCDAGNPSRKGDCGPEVNKYTDSTLEYWCADFVSWVFKQAGTPFTGGQSGGWRIAGVSSVRAWFEKNGTYTKNGPGVIPNPGDTYMTDGESHIGIVEKVENGTVYTISGNTSTENYRNGVGVGRGSYKIGSSGISGYGSLKK